VSFPYKFPVPLGGDMMVNVIFDGTVNEADDVTPIELLNGIILITRPDNSIVTTLEVTTLSDGSFVENTELSDGVYSAVATFSKEGYIDGIAKVDFTVKPELKKMVVTLNVSME